jgi:hypothetical protein
MNDFDRNIDSYGKNTALSDQLAGAAAEHIA